MITEVRQRVQSGRSGGAASARGARGKGHARIRRSMARAVRLRGDVNSGNVDAGQHPPHCLIPHGNQAASRAFSQAAMLASAAARRCFRHAVFLASAYSTGNVNDAKQNSRHTALGWGADARPARASRHHDQLLVQLAAGASGSGTLAITTRIRSTPTRSAVATQYRMTGTSGVFSDTNLGHFGREPYQVVVPKHRYATPAGRSPRTRWPSATST